MYIFKLFIGAYYVTGLLAGIYAWYNLDDTPNDEIKLKEPIEIEMISINHRNDNRVFLPDS